MTNCDIMKRQEIRQIVKAHLEEKLLKEMKSQLSETIGDIVKLNLREYDLAHKTGYSLKIDPDKDIGVNLTSVARKTIEDITEDIYEVSQKKRNSKTTTEV